MTVKALIASFTQQEDLNFLLTNRIPRAALTRFMGWFSKIENPLVRDGSIALWKLFSDLDLSEGKKDHFKSLHDCFTRELKPGLRPFDRRDEQARNPFFLLDRAMDRGVQCESIGLRAAGCEDHVLRPRIGEQRHLIARN